MKSNNKNRKANLLKRNQAIITTYKYWKKELECSDIKIWAKYIAPEYYISLRTFKTLLSINFELEKRRLEVQGEQQDADNIDK